MAVATTSRIYELQVKLAAESLAALKKLQTAADKTQKSMQKMESGFEGIKQGLAAYLTMDTFIAGISDAIAHVDDLATSAQRLGIGIESFSRLNYIAEQTDVSAGDLNVALKELVKTMGMMGSATDKGANIVKALGIDTAGDDVETAMKKIFTALNTIEDPIVRQNALIEIFGKNGLALGPMMATVGEEMDALADKSDRLGRTLSEETATALGDLDNMMNDLRGTTQAMFVQISTGLAPTLEMLGDVMLDAATEGDGFVAVGEKIGTVLRGLANGVAIVATGFEIVGERIGAVLAALTQAAQGNISQAFDILKMSAQDTVQSVVDLGTTLTELSIVEKTAGEEIKKASAETAASAGTISAINTILSANTAETNKNTKAKKENANAAKEMLPGEKEWLELQKEAASIISNNRTALEVFNDRIARLQELQRSHLLTAEQYNREVWASAEAYQASTTAADKSAEALIGIDAALEGISNSLPQYGQQMASTLVDFATGADDAATSFGDMAESILRDIAKMITQMLVMKPLMDSISGYVGSFMPAAQGAVVQSGHQAKAFAQGGVVSSPTVFPMANGTGLMGEAGPEAIIPLKRLANGNLGVGAEGGGDGSGVVVNVYNESGAQVTTETNSGPNGEQVINIMVQKAVEKAIGAGRFDSTFKQVYGLNRRGS
jgi:hypothetical protein